MTTAHNHAKRPAHVFMTQHTEQGPPPSEFTFFNSTFWTKLDSLEPMGRRSPSVDIPCAVFTGFRGC